VLKNIRERVAEMKKKCIFAASKRVEKTEINEEKIRQ